MCKYVGVVLKQFQKHSNDLLRSASLVHSNADDRPRRAEVTKSASSASAKKGANKVEATTPQKCKKPAKQADGKGLKMERKNIHSRAWHQARCRALRELGMDHTAAKACPQSIATATCCAYRSAFCDQWLIAIELVERLDRQSVINQCARAQSGGVCQGAGEDRSAGVLRRVSQPALHVHELVFVCASDVGLAWSCNVSVHAGSAPSR